MTEEPGSYYDKVQRWWKNLPVLVWIVVAAGVIGGVLGLLGVFQQAFGGLWSPAPAELVRISIKPVDPRFVSAGELMNWGGGSQALFVEFEGEPPAELDLRRLADAGGHARVWETMNGLAPTLQIDAVYDAESGAPTCVIEECGVEATAVTAPGHGRFLYYGTGGAEGARDFGECLLEPKGGTLPVREWTESNEGDEVRRPEKVYYLKPGEPLFLEVDVGRPKSALATAGSGAFTLRAYARVRIDGESTVVRSAQCVRVVMPWSAAGVEWVDLLDGWTEASPEEPWNPLEDLRPQAYFPAGN